jgi:hypothetical protein
MAVFSVRAALLCLVFACCVLASCQRQSVAIPASSPLAQAALLQEPTSTSGTLSYAGVPAAAQLPPVKPRLPARHRAPQGRAATAAPRRLLRSEARQRAARHQGTASPRDFDPSVWKFFGVACVLLAGLAAGLLLVGLVLLVEAASGAALWCLAGAAVSAVAALVAFAIHGS